MPLSCRGVSSYLTDHPDGGGAWLARATVRLHLSLCADCTRFLAQVVSVRAGLAALGAEPASTATREALVARFRAFSGRNPGEGR